MKECVEFRIPEDHATSWLRTDEGVRLGDTIRKVVVAPDDPLWERLANAHSELRRGGRELFSSWKLTRTYSDDELRLAQLLRLKITTVFEPAGEECGTLYDETTACPVCGAGGQQVSALSLPPRAIPRSADLARTIAGEIIVSARAISALQSGGIRGLRADVVLDAKTKQPLEGWRQLRIPTPMLDVAPRTRTGVDPFDADPGNMYRCPTGHTLGLNVLSEVWVEQSLDSTDFAVSAQFIGVRGGLLRPDRLMFISVPVWETLRARRLKGWTVERVYLAQ